MPTAPPVERSSEPLAILAVSRAGARLSARLGQAWPDAERYVLERYRDAEDPTAISLRSPIGPKVAELFAHRDGLVFFLPVGAVVRLVAPYLRNKLSDPAVVAVDDGGRFAVSVLSGHTGGGNALAERVADLLEAQAVITTAVDRLGLPSPELLGRPFGWKLEATREALLRASAALANAEPLGLYQEHARGRWLLRGAVVRRFQSLAALASSGVEAAIVITDRRLPDEAAEAYVVWRPRQLVAGLGCSTGAPSSEVEALLRAALESAGLAAAGLGLLATLDRKQSEPGFRELAARLGLDLRGYTAAELGAISVPNPSEVVRRAVGTPSVAEAAALLASGGGQLLVPKRASPHATVAIARQNASIASRGDVERRTPR